MPAAEKPFCDWVEGRGAAASLCLKPAVCRVEPGFSFKLLCKEHAKQFEVYRKEAGAFLPTFDEWQAQARFEDKAKRVRRKAEAAQAAEIMRAENPGWFPNG